MLTEYFRNTARPFAGNETKMLPDYLEKKGRAITAPSSHKNCWLTSELEHYLPVEIKKLRSAQMSHYLLMAALRSSIRSRSTSQNLSDERRRLCTGSSSLVSSPFEVALRDASEPLVDFCSLRLDLDALKRLRLSRPALINDSPFS
jgi:hypothetical protein